MANHASAKKADRQNERRNLHNKYYAKTTRNAIRDIRKMTDKKAAEEGAPKVYAMIDWGDSQEQGFKPQEWDCRLYQ